MQEILKFTLKGSSAVIRKPESNFTYFSYNNVHKIMLLGILGAIIGENGYNYNILNGRGNELPEFYENLRHVKLAIRPKSKNYGNFTKKIQVFNNSVGYASKEKGNNLIVNEQWLENPYWEIYLLDDDTKEYKKIKEYLLNNKCEYIPYIGKNDHFANISQVEMLVGKNVDNVDKIDSLFIENGYKVKEDIFDSVLFDDENEVKFEYKEVMPTKLDSKIGYTDYINFIFTNKNIEFHKRDIDKIYEIENNNIYFF